MYSNSTVKIGDRFLSPNSEIEITDIILSERGNPIKLRYQNVKKKKEEDRRKKLKKI